MTPKQYLEQALMLHQRVKKQRRACAMLELEAEGPRSPGFDRHYGGGSREAPYICAVEKLQIEQARLKATEELLKKLQTQMLEVIGQLERDEWQDLLRYRYVYGQTWEQVASELFVSIASAYVWHRQALTQILLPKDAIDLRKKQSAEDHASSGIPTGKSL